MGVELYVLNYLVVVGVVIEGGRGSQPFISAKRDPSDGINGDEGFGMAPKLHNCIFLRGFADLEPRLSRRRLNCSHYRAPSLHSFRYCMPIRLHDLVGSDNKTITNQTFCGIPIRPVNVSGSIRVHDL